MKTLLSAVKLLIVLAAVGTTVFTSKGFAQATKLLPSLPGDFIDLTLMQEIEVLPTTVFIPTGFDDDDNVQIVVDGELPSTCYKQGPIDFKVDQKNKVIIVHQRAYVRKDEGCFCLEVIVHYNTTLDLGVLEAGKYQVLVETQDSPATHDFGVLNVAKSPEHRTESSDSVLYAPVEAVHVEYPQGSTEAHEAVIQLDVLFQNTCWKMQETRLKLSGNILEVLPIAKVDSKGKCLQLMRRETIAVPLTSNLTDQVVKPGRYLVHVRALNGRAVNLVTEL